MAYKVVTFIGEEIKERDDLNSIFALPKSLKELSDGIKEQFLPRISELYSNEDWYNSWVTKYKNIQNLTNNKIIENIISENINDLYRTSLIWFIDNFFGNYIENNLYNFQYNISNGIDYYIPTTFDYKDPTVIYIRLDQIADLYIMEITKAYNMVIYEKFMTLMNIGKGNEFYESMFKMVYKQDPTNYNADYIYTFCMSILRENAENEIIKIRKAITLIMGNAATSLSEKSISNLDVVKMIEENGNN